MARRIGKMKISVAENVGDHILAAELAMNGPTLTKAMWAGAGVLKNAVQKNAPVRKGLLRESVVRISVNQSEFRHLTRRGKTMTTAVKAKPRPGKVLLAATAFYSQWVETGHALLKGDRARNQPDRKKKKGAPTTRRRPFFRRSIAAAQPLANMVIKTYLKRVLTQELK
ncbi:MAG: hypothetical protein KAX65_00535 [Caldilineaceae bacterium]|nr:hypothetical protein [Caldilineaceae bacterium]